jgi:VWFA-related protein
MFIRRSVFVSLVPVSLLLAAVLSGQDQATALRDASQIHLDVVVTAKSGLPISGLQQQDFKLTDNKSPRGITSFRAFAGNQAPVEAVLVVDAVNADYQTVAYEREQIDKVLRSEGGHLAQAMALAFFTDTGTQIQEGYSRDGNGLSALLEKYTVGLRNLRRSTGVYGAEERFQLSLQALDMLTAREASRPGRKLVLWVSPGWPLLTGPRTDLDLNQQQRIFADVVGLSTRLRQARITLYSINPLGADESQVRASYYEEFVKGVKEPGQVEPANLALQVLATQSGGLALDFNNDVAGLLRRCLADTQSYYEITFDPPLPDRRDEYHQLEIKVAKPGLTARTHQGYYAQPVPR